MVIFAVPTVDVVSNATDTALTNGSRVETVPAVAVRYSGS